MVCTKYSVSVSGSRAARMQATVMPMREEISWYPATAPAVPMLMDTGLADVMHVLKLACGAGAYAKTEELMATEPPTGNAVVAPAGYSFRPLCRELGMGPPIAPDAGGHANWGGVLPKPVAGVAIGSITAGHASPGLIEKLKYNIVCICRASTQLPAGSRADAKSRVHSPLEEGPAAVAEDKHRVISTPPRIDDVQFWFPSDSIYAPA